MTCLHRHVVLRVESTLNKSVPKSSRTHCHFVSYVVTYTQRGRQQKNEGLIWAEWIGNSNKMAVWGKKSRTSVFLIFIRRKPLMFIPTSNSWLSKLENLFSLVRKSYHILFIVKYKVILIWERPFMPSKLHPSKLKSKNLLCFQPRLYLDFNEKIYFS